MARKADAKVMRGGVQDLDSQLKCCSCRTEPRVPGVVMAKVCPRAIVVQKWESKYRREASRSGTVKRVGLEESLLSWGGAIQGLSESRQSDLFHLSWDYPRTRL